MVKWKNFVPIIKLTLLLIILFNVLASSWYVIHGELNFQTDIARDFLLLNQINEKKVMLVGARAGVAGMFHGIAWPYINFPVFSLSRGNPVSVAWFWVILIITSLYTGFKIAGKLFNSTTAYFYTALASSYLVYQANEITHPQASFMLMPVVFYLFWQYINTFKIKYFIGFILTCGLLVHFEIAFGGPFLVLAAIYILFLQFKQHKLSHAWVFSLIFLPILPYILFDLRHDFLQFNSLIGYLGNKHVMPYDFSFVITSRIIYMFSLGLPVFSSAIFYYHIAWMNQVLALLCLWVLATAIIYKQNRKLYLIFIYFFLGYFIISISNRYALLIQHFMAFVPIVLMVFASLVFTKYGKILIIPFVIVMLINSTADFGYMRNSQKLFGIKENSWIALKQIADDVYKENSRDFGYFVYSPDKIAYQGKYAMVYGQLQNPNKKAGYFEKKPVTYIVSAPHPPNDPWVLDSYWIINSLKITKPPQSTKSYPNGYKVHRYTLTPEEISIPWDKVEDTGIFFR